MAALERQARAPMGFVASSTGLDGAKGTGETSKNADEIDLGDDEDL